VVTEKAIKIRVTGPMAVRTGATAQMTAAVISRAIVKMTVRVISRVIVKMTVRAISRATIPMTVKLVRKQGKMMVKGEVKVLIAMKKVIRISDLTETGANREKIIKIRRIGRIDQRARNIKENRKAGIVKENRRVEIKKEAVITETEIGSVTVGVARMAAQREIRTA